MRFLGRFAALALCLSLVVVLNGCTDRDDDARDQVGELRVFDTPSSDRVSSNDRSENVPAPAPATQIHETVVYKASPKTVQSAPPKHVMVGELDVFDN